jgi:transposase
MCLSVIRSLRSDSLSREWHHRHRLAKPLWEELQQCLELGRRLVADGGATARAIDYTLGHRAALTRHLDDGAVAIDNNDLERQINPWAMALKAWMFVGSELAGQRAAILLSLVQSARMNGHDPWVYGQRLKQKHGELGIDAQGQGPAGGKQG